VRLAWNPDLNVVLSEQADAPPAASHDGSPTNEEVRA